MNITDDIIKMVSVSIKSWQRASKGVSPPGYEWDDLTQDAYVLILEDNKFDSARGTLGARVNFHVGEAIRRAYRDKLPLTNWFNRDEDSAQTPDVPVESDSHIPTDSRDFLDSLGKEDQAVIERHKNKTPHPRNSPARRRDTRRLKRLKDKIVK